MWAKLLVADYWHKIYGYTKVRALEFANKKLKRNIGRIRTMKFGFSRTAPPPFDPPPPPFAAELPFPWVK